MRGFRERFYYFMQGRYGADQLAFGLLGLCVFLALLNAFIGTFLISLLQFSLLAWIFFRMLSRNIPARRRENDAFLKAFGPMISRIQQKGRQLKDTTHVYKKCPHCKSQLRLPRRRGKHTVRCPRCAKEFRIHVIYN